MAFLECRFFSEVLGLQCTVNVLLPDPPEKPKHCLWLLHGLSDDHSAWMRNSAVERHVQGRSLAVIMPAVGRSFYCDMKQGGKYWSFLSEELPRKMHGLFNLPKGRDHHFAAGLSMGGYGAFKLALKRPDWISAAASLSGALDLSGRLWEPDFKFIFGAKARIPAGDDLLKLAKLVSKRRPPKARFYQCCGTGDFLYEANQRFRSLAEKLRLDLTYEEECAGHDWAYWDAMLPRALDWLLKRPRG